MSNKSNYLFIFVEESSNHTAGIIITESIKLPMTDIITELQHEFTLPFTNPVLIFTILLLIVLLAPILLKRFNVPSIIGLIVAGVIVGSPYGLNWIDNYWGS